MKLKECNVEVEIGLSREEYWAMRDILVDDDFFKKDWFFSNFDRGFFGAISNTEKYLALKDGFGYLVGLELKEVCYIRRYTLKIWAVGVPALLITLDRLGCRYIVEKNLKLEADKI